MKRIALILASVLFCATISVAQGMQMQDFSDFFGVELDAVPVIPESVYKSFTIQIFHNSNGFRFEAYRMLRVNDRRVRSDKAVKYFGQGFQQYSWDATNNYVGISDYIVLAGPTYRGWGQYSRAMAGQMLPWMPFHHGQIVFVSYERGREWCWAQHWNTLSGAEKAARAFIDYAIGSR